MKFTIPMEAKTKIKSFVLRKFTKKNKVSFDIKKSKKVLIFRYDRIGDMILTTPLFKELKKAYPEIEISVLASKANKDVIKYNPYVSKIYTNYKNSILSDLFELIKLRFKNFDVCIELDHSIIPHAIIRHKIIKPKAIISIHKYPRYGVIANQLELYDYMTKKNETSHFSNIWLDTLNFFGLNVTSSSYDFFLGDIERHKAREFISNISESFKICINVEAFSSEKRLDMFNLIKICEELYRENNEIKIILLSTPKFRASLKKIVHKIDLSFVCISYDTKTIIDAAALIEKIDMVITPDTSIVHIASSFNKPVVSIHENNAKSFRLWAPKSSLNRTVFAKSNIGLHDYNVSEVVSSAIDIMNLLKENK